MKRLKLIKALANLLVAFSVMVLIPVGASAEWKQNSTGWWYTEGNSWYTGWKLISGNWYYFYSDGYMAKNTTIDGYFLNGSGIWTNSSSTETKVTLSDVDYSNKLADIYTRLHTWNDSYKDIVNKVYNDSSYVMSDTFKQNMADNKTEIDKIYKEACTLNPSDTFKGINNSVVGFIKNFDDGMRLYNDGISENDITKIEKADELMKEGSAESVKTIEIVKDLKAKLNK